MVCGSARETSVGDALAARARTRETKVTDSIMAGLQGKSTVLAKVVCVHASTYSAKCCSPLLRHPQDAHAPKRRSIRVVDQACRAKRASAWRVGVRVHCETGHVSTYIVEGSEVDSWTDR